MSAAHRRCSRLRRNSFTKCLQPSLVTSKDLNQLKKRRFKMRTMTWRAISEGTTFTKKRRAQSSSPREMAHSAHPHDAMTSTSAPGLTLVHFSAQPEPLLTQITL